MAGQIINRGDSTWLVRVYLGTDPRTGKRKYHNKTIHGTKKKAANYLSHAIIDRDLGAFAIPSKVTMGELLEDIKRDYQINGKSIDWCTIVVNKHLEPFFGALKAAKLTTTLVEQYIDARQKKGIANGTINRELTILRRALNLGTLSKPKKVINPPKIPRLKEDPPRKGFFEYEEFLALRCELPAHLRAPITFAFYTGCRKGEVLALGLDQIDFGERLVRLNPGETKNEQGRVIPLLGDLYDILVTQRDIRDQQYPDCPWAFFKDGGPIGKDFRGAWEAACKRLAEREENPIKGLWDPKARDGEGAPTRLFHDLRRTGARNLVRAGVPERVVMDIGGWKTRAVFDRYNIVDERDLKAAGAKLDAYLKAQSKKPHTIRTQTKKSTAGKPIREARKLLK